MASKKVLILNGSPRPEGNSSILADQVRKGVEQAGGEAEVIYLHGLDINPCDACDSCQGMAEIDCIVEVDDHDIERCQQALDCYVTFQETIEKTGIKNYIYKHAVFEVFQENFDPPLDDLFAALN